MRHKFAILSFWFVLGTLSLFFAQGLSAQSSQAHASKPVLNPGPANTTIGCGYFGGPLPAAPAPARPARKPSRSEGEAAKASLVTISNSSTNSGRGSGQDIRGFLRTIVGLWSFQFVSEGNDGIPDNTVLDQGYAMWHADGTEMINSGKPPITSSFCMGVWKPTGLFTYKLNHVALSWDPSGTTFVGPASIREEVTLDHSGDSYSGTFTIDQFDTNGNVIAHVQGTVNATRITADQ